MTVAVYRSSRIVVATLAAIAIVGIPWYYVVQKLSHVRPVDAPAWSVFWGPHYFNTSDDLAKWLHSRGATYELWARRHPHAATRIERGSAGS